MLSGELKEHDVAKKIKQPIHLQLNQNLTVGANVIYVADGVEESAVYSYDGNHSVRVLGTVTAIYDAINLGDVNEVANNVVEIARTGVVKVTQSEFSFVDGDAIQLHGGTNTVINHGVVKSATGYGISIPSGAPAGLTTITNTGTISGEAGFFVNTSDTVRLKNSGTIRGDETAYKTDFHDHADLMTNSGKIFGDIYLGGGNDAYNGKSGMVRGVVYGGAGGDKLRGGSEHNEFFGDSGADRLTGGRGADRLAGGTEADVFVFGSVRDSSVKASGRDFILDFSQMQADILDLAGIDANEKRKGNQSFHFIGSEDFHKKAGELHYQFKSGETLVSGDTDGDGKADFAIELAGSITLTSNDFVL